MSTYIDMMGSESYLPVNVYVYHADMLSQSSQQDSHMTRIWRHTSRCLHTYSDVDNRVHSNQQDNLATTSCHGNSLTSSD